MADKAKTLHIQLERASVIVLIIHVSPLTGHLGKDNGSIDVSDGPDCSTGIKTDLSPTEVWDVVKKWEGEADQEQEDAGLKD